MGKRKEGGREGGKRELRRGDGDAEQIVARGPE
jgi:hypothetical protein